MKVKAKSLSCVQLCDPMDSSLPDSSVHGILQARTLEWVASFLFQEILLTQGSNPHLLCLWASLVAQLVKNLPAMRET